MKTSFLRTGLLPIQFRHSGPNSNQRQGTNPTVTKGAGAKQVLMKFGVDLGSPGCEQDNRGSHEQTVLVLLEE
jgi:hypothetical protein